MKMLYWVIYDISDNKKRSKISEECKNFGLFRIQKSAFLGRLSKNKIEMLSIRFKTILGEEGSDCIFLIPACESCFKNKFIIGSLDEEKAKQKDFILVK